MKLKDLKLKTSTGVTINLDETSLVYGNENNGNHHSVLVSELEVAESEKPKEEIDNKLQSRLLDIIEIQARK